MIKKNTVPQRVRNVSKQFPDAIALRFRPTPKSDFKEITFETLWQTVREVAASFISIGIKKSDHVAIISDNRHEWIFCDLALMGLGAIDIPRGSDSNAEEISYIIEHSDSKYVILENKAQLDKLESRNPKFKGITKIILMDFDPSLANKKSSTPLIPLQELLEKGKGLSKEQETFDTILDEGKREEISSIIYTSGTTGNPKGVMLTHESFIFQLERIYEYIPIKQGHIMLSVLPIWHTFERMCEYIVLNTGASIAYSKTIGPIMLGDLKTLNPQWFISVPRIWISIYDSIFRKLRKESKLKYNLFMAFTSISTFWCRMENLMNGKTPAFMPINKTFNQAIACIPYILLYPLKKLGDLLVFNKLKSLLGNRFFAGVSGGGALPDYVDTFFQAAGIQILEGYGLTETGPVLSVRKSSHPIMYTIGSLLKDIEFKIVDTHGNSLEPGNKGRLFIKSPQTMKRYYKNEEKTKEVLTDGWLDTGDLAIETWNNHALKIVGRAKETIVLVGGENIEPSPLEEKLLSSELIDNVMIVGQDQKFLGALLCLNLEQVKALFANQTEPWVDEGELLQSETLRGILNQEIQQIISSKNGFKPFEKICRFTVLEKPFEEGIEMTKTLKLKRNVIEEIYKNEIKSMFAN